MSVENGSEYALQAARFLVDRKAELELPDLRIETQEEFLRRAAAEPPLSRVEKVMLLEQTERVLRDLYAHLPFKKVSAQDRDPFFALEGVRGQLDQLTELDFHLCMLLVFATVRDVHTGYVAPTPYRGAVAFLPFEIRFFEERKGEFRFIVSKRMATEDDARFAPEHFVVGAEVMAWNGIEAGEATMVAAQLQPGANQDAELSRGVARMTLRSIASHGVAGGGGIPPFAVSNEAVIRYRAPGEKKEREISFPWMVATGFGGQSFASAAFSSSVAMTELQHWSKCSYRPEKLKAKAEAPGGGAADFIETQFALEEAKRGFPAPELMRNPDQAEWSAGYLRIRHFANDVGSLFEEAKLEQVRTVLERFNREARGGLIVDIRGNPGGQIRIAERMLQYFSPREIQPLRFHFPRTALVEQVIAMLREETGSAGEFSAWLEAKPGDEETDPRLTPGRTLTPPELANDTGQIYQGPVVLLFDALTYSAADMFAAGFQDHQIGELIGVDCSTGGGGANAWSYQDIVDNLPKVPGLEMAALPRDCRVSVAVRRCTRTNAEREPIEDIGVAPNHFHARTRRDVLEGNADLFEFACERLMAAPVFRIDVTRREETAAGLEVELNCFGLGFVRFRAGEATITRGVVREGEPARFTIALTEGLPEVIQVEGYQSERECDEGLPPLAAPRIRRSGAPVEQQPLTFRRQREEQSA